jgi:hypothetical protein
MLAVGITCKNNYNLAVFPTSQQKEQGKRKQFNQQCSLRLHLQTLYGKLVLADKSLYIEDRKSPYQQEKCNQE